jgi:hypothetical protein
MTARLGETEEEAAKGRVTEGSGDRDHMTLQAALLDMLSVSRVISNCFTELFQGDSSHTPHLPSWTHATASCRGSEGRGFDSR